MKKIAIILPAYNGAQYVKNAIESVLRQSFTEWELFVINDGSADNTGDVVIPFAEKDDRIKYIKNEKNLGVQETRNKALGLVSSEYIAEIDQDDIWLDKDKLKKQIDFLEKNKEHVLIGTGVIVVDERGFEIAKYLMPETDTEIRNKILRANPFIHSSVLYRTKAVKDIGGYTVSKMSEDHDLWLRMGRMGKFKNIQEYSTQYCFSLNGYNSQDKFVRLKQNLLFAKEHKGFYPGYWRAIFLGWVKILTYPIFYIMPVKMKGRLLKLHKSF